MGLRVKGLGFRVLARKKRDLGYLFFSLYNSNSETPGKEQGKWNGTWDLVGIYTLNPKP